jgi:integrase
MSKKKNSGEATKMYQGTIVQRGEKWYWRHKLPNGKMTNTALSCAYSEQSAIRQIMCLQFHQTHPTVAIKTPNASYYVPPVIPQYNTVTAPRTEKQNVSTQGKLPLTQLFDAFISNPGRNGISKGVEANYFCTVRQFVEYFTAKKYKTANEVTSKEAEEYMAYRWKDGISGATYNDILNRLRIVFSMALPEQENPFKGIKTKPKHTEERQAFTEEQLQQIWRTLADSSFHIMHKEEVEILLTLALNTGLRLGDLCNLQWKSIDLDKRLIKITPSKTKESSGKKVLLPMNDRVYDVLRKQHALTAENNQVLPQLANRYAYNKDGISHDIIRLLEVAGIQTKEEADTTHRKERISRYSFHSFRHTFASMLIANGVAPITVSKLLGHTTLNMTNRYVHLAEKSARSAVSKLDSVTDL